MQELIKLTFKGEIPEQVFTIEGRIKHTVEKGDVFVCKRSIGKQYLKHGRRFELAEEGSEITKTKPIAKQSAFLTARIIQANKIAKSEKAQDKARQRDERDLEKEMKASEEARMQSLKIAAEKKLAARTEIIIEEPIEPTEPTEPTEPPETPKTPEDTPDPKVDDPGAEKENKKENKDKPEPATAPKVNKK